MGPKRDLRRIDPSSIVRTAERLSARVGERFPDNDLAVVARETALIAAETVQRIEKLSAPKVFARLAAGLAGLCVVGGVATVTWAGVGGVNRSGGVAWIATTESAINDLVFAAIALTFLAKIDTYFHRRGALSSIRPLRSAAHVIDLHQLTKDPFGALVGGLALTESSPVRSMKQVELERYLQYCIELLSVIGVLGALHAQELQDPVVIEAVGDIETLTVDLSLKIWNKISVSRLAMQQRPPDGP